MRKALRGGGLAPYQGATFSTDTLWRRAIAQMKAHGLNFMNLLKILKTIIFFRQEVVSKSGETLKTMDFARFPFVFPNEITMGKSTASTLGGHNYLQVELTDLLNFCFPES